MQHADAVMLRLVDQFNKNSAGVLYTKIKTQFLKLLFPTVTCP